MDYRDSVLEKVRLASKTWQNAFNSGDADGCASCYEEGALIISTSFGNFKGRSEIKNFWEKIISDGFSDVEYTDTKIEVLDESTAILSSKWQMNHAQGIITKELWVIQPDGHALLREDHFEVKQ